MSHSAEGAWEAAGWSGGPHPTETDSVASSSMAAVRTAEPPPPGAGTGTIEELFHALESPLLVYARRLVPDLDMAEDLVQEAFLRLHPLFDEVHSPRAWLYRTVHNLALNHRRDAGKIVPFVAPTDADGGPDSGPGREREFIDPLPLPDDELARREGVGLVRRKLENLDARSRELVRLKFNEGLSYEQISQRTD